MHELVNLLGKITESCPNFLRSGSKDLENVTLFSREKAGTSVAASGEAIAVTVKSVRLTENPARLTVFSVSRAGFAESRGVCAGGTGAFELVAVKKPDNGLKTACGWRGASPGR